MSSNLRVSVAWGIDPFNDGEEPWIDNDGHSEGPEEWLLRMAGIPLDRPPEPVAWNLTPSEREAFSEHYKIRQAALTTLDIDVSLVGESDYSRWILHIKSTLQTEGEDLVAIDDNLSTTQNEDKFERFREFCATAGIECKNPGWKAFAFYG